MSDPATVELVRPKLESPEWKDKDGGSVSKSLVGEELTMSVKCTDMEDGTGVTFTVIDSGTNQEIAEVGAIVTGGKAEAVWTYRYKHDSDHPLTAKPKYKFKVKSMRAAAVKSGDVEISQSIKEKILLSDGTPVSQRKYVIHMQNGDTLEGTTDTEGLLEASELIPGIYEIEIQEKENG